MLMASGLVGLSALQVALVPVAIAQDALSAEQDKNTPKSSENLALPVGINSFNSAIANPETKVSEPEGFGPETVLPIAPVDASMLSPEFSVTGNGNTYIDPTDYAIGATELPSVVLSERSTGCSRVLEQGRVTSNSICQSTAVGSHYGSYGYPDVNSVRVGPISVGADGIRLIRSFNISDYYNRTVRPEAFAGNENRQMMFPLSIPALISSPFGWRSHPIFGNTRFHTGTDIAAPMGTPVVATYSGRITVADFLGGYGLTVVIRHEDNSIETLYGHLSEVFVRPGEMIQQGEVIGRVGSTGNSTGPHLHFELRQPTADGWVAVNSGDLLQNALALVHNGLQLASDVSPEDDDRLALNIPDFLLSGKNAVKGTDVASETDDLKADARNIPSTGK
jgi:hypothetical protein